MSGPGTQNLDLLRVSPFYFSSVNALTKPNQVIFCSRYFVRRWMPLLGGTGTQIVLYLRSLGYYNRQTGEKRDEIAVKLRDIAEACRCSQATVRREFANNEALQLFVQLRHRWEPDPSSGQPRQCENGYRVAMDDPPHAADMDWIATYIAQEEAERQAQATPPAQFARGE